MLILGLSGLFATADDELMPRLAPTFCHDAAAALIDEDGVVMAVEEERLNRVKHTNAFPLNAVRACLDAAGAGIGAVDRIAYFFDETYTDRELTKEYLSRPHLAIRSSRELIVDRLSEAFDTPVDPSVVRFHEHHRTHAALAYVQSGFETAAVCVVDGNGEDDSLSLYRATPEGLALLGKYHRRISLGHLYSAVTRLLGFGNFDEYKVMGLAAKGDPSLFRAVFAGMYDLGSEGRYDLDVAQAENAVLAAGYRPRRAFQRIRQQDCDLAAALQETIERIALHVLRHLRDAAGSGALCISGGVAHNSTLNGLIARTGLFDEIFVHPASHDGGAALGAALLTHWEEKSCPGPAHVLRHPYLGSDLGSDEAIERVLGEWSTLVSWDLQEDVCGTAAKLLAEGAIVGWAQGRSEYGPRALGNRSILADPRPAENKDRINALVKRRESFQPFAPAVTREAAGSCFELPACRARYDFMSFVVPVKEAARPVLGAVTHVDGSARIQVVGKDVNPRFHALIEAFGALTGVPVLLNTSFNNRSEPIVETVGDAVSTLLTANLDCMVCGSFVVRPLQAGPDAFLGMQLSLGDFVRLGEVTEQVGAHTRTVHRATTAHGEGRSRELGPEAYAVLRTVGEGRPIGNLVAPGLLSQALLRELLELWREGLVRVAPGRSTSSLPAQGTEQASAGAGRRERAAGAPAGAGSAPSAGLAFSHVRVDVSDLPRAVDFYRNVLGLEEVVRHATAERELVQMGVRGRLPGLELWYEPALGPPMPARTHVAFQVEDVDGCYREAVRRGAEGLVAPFSKGAERIAFIRDPDGHAVELIDVGSQGPRDYSAAQ